MKLVAHIASGYHFTFVCSPDLYYAQFTNQDKGSLFMSFLHAHSFPLCIKNTCPERQDTILRYVLSVI